MTTPKILDRQTTPEERSEQLRAALARRTALDVLPPVHDGHPAGCKCAEGEQEQAERERVLALDTFHAAVPEAAAAQIDLIAPGFGKTDTTEITGDATFDQDVHDAAGDDVENEELADGQSALDDYRKAKDDAVSALAPPDDAGHKPPTIDDPASRIGGSGAEQGSGGGGGANSDIAAGSNGVHGAGFAEGIPTGSDSVSSAGGPQSDSSNLLGNPRDLVQRGGGNSAASDSDAVHVALGEVVEEKARATADKYSVANDGGALAAAISSASQTSDEEKAAAQGVSPTLGSGAEADWMDAKGRPSPPEERGLFTAVFEWISGDRKLMGDAGSGIPAKDYSGIEGFEPVTDKVKNATERQRVLGGSGQSGVEVPSNPDDPNGGPPSEAELALRAATNKLLGRNDALLHGPATQIDPGEQGEVFRTDGTPLASSAERAQSLFGTPKDESAGHAPAPSLDGAAPPIGPDGTEVLVEDGNPFTGGQRSEGPEDVLFGTQDPLVGLDGGAARDALPPQEDDSSGDVGKRSTFDLFDD